jgi:hypothetical protein
MPCQRPPRPLSVLASALAAAGILLAAGGCSHIAPLGPDPSPVSLPPPGPLGSPIIVQVMSSQPPTPTGECPAGSVDLFGSEPNLPRAVYIRAQPVACYLPAGRPVTITSAAVSSVTTHRNQPGPAWYVFVVAFPTADVAALTALIRQAYDSGDALGMSVDGKLWQAPQPRSKFSALRAEQINLLSRNQAFQLYRLLVPSG